MKTDPVARSSTCRVFRAVVKLVLCTLRHEWVPGLCLVLSLGAVLAPLLLVLGLKYGTVNALRSRLLRDPRNLELRPATSEPIDDDAIHALKTIPGVAFVVPTTRLLGASVNVRFGSQTTSIDLQPSASSDPLMDAYDCKPPGPGEVVLAAAAAAKLGPVKLGDEVTVEASRLNGGVEKATTPLRVSGLLPVEATGIATAYVPVAFQEMIEQYKDGQAVSALGWPGKLPLATAQYDGLMILSSAGLQAQIVSRLCVETGFTSHRELSPADAILLPASYREGRPAGILCYNHNAPQHASALTLAGDVVRGTGALVIPWTQPIEAVVQLTDGQNVRGNLDGSPGVPEWVNNGDGRSPPVLFVGQGVPEGAATLLVNSGPHSLRLPVVLRHEATSISGDQFRAPTELAGILRLLGKRHLVWDDKSAAVLLGRRAHSGFRLYVHQLEDVAPVSGLLEAKGIRCHSEASQIARITSLDRDLTLVFRLISIFGIGGACSALALSLYGAVERRRRDYGMLRTLGLRRCWIVVLPLIEGLVLILAAFALGAGCFHLVAGVINRLFATQAAGDAFCVIPPELLAVACGLAVALGLAASLGAAIRLTAISPADAIRAN